MPPPQLRDLEREVFGGSDSEFSDDDDNDGLSSLSLSSLLFPFLTLSRPPAPPFTSPATLLQVTT